MKADHRLGLTHSAIAKFSPRLRPVQNRHQIGLLPKRTTSSSPQFHFGNLGFYRPTSEALPSFLRRDRRDLRTRNHPKNLKVNDLWSQDRFRQTSPTRPWPKIAAASVH